jgi:cob(I)alamin adenosyltransferase
MQAARYSATGSSSVGTTEASTTTERLTQLEQSLFEATEGLATRTQELEAARQINRELISRLNRERH